MLVIIRERIRDLRRQGMTLEQIKARRPSLDYDTEYTATLADADRFVETIYRTMSTTPASAQRQRTRAADEANDRDCTGAGDDSGREPRSVGAAGPGPGGRDGSPPRHRPRGGRLRSI